MLTRLLSNFSEDELLGFLPKNSVSFTLNALSKGVQESEPVYLSKSKIASVVASVKAVDFVFNRKMREKLIERMSTEQLVGMFPSFKIDSTQVTAEHYDAVVSWAEQNSDQFASILGLSSLYESQSTDADKIESIAHIEPDYGLYPYQQKISSQTLDDLHNDKKRVLIHLPTGAGKTRTAMNIAAEHLRASDSNLVLWLADREELCSQAYEEFSKAWKSLGNRSATVYGFYSDSTESLSGIDSGFVVAGLHKFLSIRKSDSRQLKLLYKQLAEKVTLVIFDEAHKAVAPKYQEVVQDFIDIEEFNADLIGLTATPGRSFSEDGLSEEDARLADFFKNNKVSMKVSGYLSPIDYLVEKGYLAKANFKPLNYDHSKISAYELRDAGGSETMTALAKNDDRNLKILNTVLRECENGSQVIVFACTVEHGINLAIAMAYQGIKAASIDSKNDSAESRRAKIAQYKKGELQVLVNFNVLTAGFDAPKTNVTVIAKPMNSLVQYLQMAGRAMRGYKSGGNKECIIYTVMDEIPEFKSISLAFGYWNDMWAEKEID